ncbi:branched-chain amino acid ABC transporter permease [Methylobacterium currus]|uniref:branched-chain amino acid ABC transporter permease n=1 Tax=Methylobacterium currus TaxID=2051553 RepID=UPI001E582850|nr:branched-chain amino acid ABC transporter permease [Methylobacterium currus]UHC19368.1 branched-chain amino acid ABC transporter permease [Methylobacterium currus]
MTRTILSLAFDALAYGMVLFIISIGLSIMMGLVRVVNLAHGAFAMMGGYIASTLLRGAGLSYLVALPLAVAATVAVTLPLERLLYRRLYRRTDPLTQILMTIGITFVIIGTANYLLGPTLKPIPLPASLSGPLDLGFRTVPTHRLFVIACGLATALGLWLLLERTEFGIRLRASVDNSDMAESLGLRTDLIYAATFALAVGLGAFGGIVGAELLPIEPFYALRYMVTFLVVVSVGGAGSIPGALAASLLLGLIDTVGKYVAPEFGEFFFYSAVIAVVAIFPNGMLGRAQ